MLGRPSPCNPAKVERGHPSPMGTRPSLPDVAPLADDPRPAPVAVGVLPYYIKRKKQKAGSWDAWPFLCYIIASSTN